MRWKEREGARHLRQARGLPAIASGGSVSGQLTNGTKFTSSAGEYEERSQQMRRQGGGPRFTSNR